MYYIYIVKGLSFQQPERRIISISDFANGSDGIDAKNCVMLFDDFTTNFNDLGFWNSIHDLHGKNTSNVVSHIKNSIRHLHYKGYRPKKLSIVDKHPPTIPRWMFGHSDNGSDLPKKERCEILLYHLTLLLKIAQTFDNQHLFFLSD